jgi:hypothetical protein
LPAMPIVAWMSPRKISDQNSETEKSDV